MGVLDLLLGWLKGKPKYAEKKYECPNCGEEITLNMERCPKCGTRIKSMFRKKCPKCGTANQIDAKKCEKCGFDFEELEVKERKTIYRCPRCGYRMDYYATRCPSCGIKFM
ncbi:MAG: zinc ribbon domain-containing protein [Candidatus Anstonellales archaeon]